MRNVSRQIVSVALALSTLPAWARAQEGGGGATISGRVTSEAGTPLASASVFLEGMNLGTLTREDGQYSFTVPAARAGGRQATLTARLIGYKPQSVTVTLAGNVAQNFALPPNPLQLGEVIVTGAGTTSTREKLGNVISSVDSTLIARSNEPNVVTALAGKAPNVEVTSSAGDPGVSTYIRIRGGKSLAGTGQPLFVVDGTPIDNATNSTVNATSTLTQVGGTGAPNRASDINPNDIESVEILKGAAAAAIYGARAAEGVVLITTKSGRPGATRYSLRSSYSWDKVTNDIPLQRRFGHGTEGTIAGSVDECTLAGELDCFTTGTSWGPELTQEAYTAALQNSDPDGIVGGLPCDAACAAVRFQQLYPNGIQTFNHWDELFDTGHTLDNTLSISGGTDRTTFFLSAGRNDQNGVMAGPHNYYDKTTARLKASHRLTDRLNLTGNFAYTDARGFFVQKGSNLGGLLLGGLRTPPNYNNHPYLDPTSQLQRSYRFPRPSVQSLDTPRIYDNPFFVLNEDVNTSELGRAFGNISTDYSPLDWLTVKHTFGADYYTDERLEAQPKTASGGIGTGAGEVIKAAFNNLELDHNLTATATHTFSPSFAGSLTLGQNINARRRRNTVVQGFGLITPKPYSLQNLVNWLPATADTTIHVESYFGQATADLWEQLYLTAALRNDGFSSFGEAKQRHWFPKFSGSWVFTNALGNQEQRGLLSFGKLRASYGEAGREPLAYQTLTTLNNLPTPGEGWGDFLNLTQAGIGGLGAGLTKGNTALKPERTKEFEAGADFGLLDGKADLGVTYYHDKSTDIILPVPVAYSSGYAFAIENAAQITNHGWELTLNVRPLTRQNFAWDIGFQWARNRGNVDDLAGATFVQRDNGNTFSLPVFQEGYQPGVIQGNDFIRCGRGLTFNDIDLDNTPGHCLGEPAGAVYLAEDGRPRTDPTLRIVADPNPDWTGSVRSSVRYKKWQLSGLLDVKHGGEVYNGTKGALYNFGTHEDTERRGEQVLIRDYLRQTAGRHYSTFAGPGVDVPTTLDQSWFTGIGGSFNGPSQQAIEDGGYVKLREISVGYTLDQRWVRRTLGLSSVDLRLAARNLHTWTNYTGIDPETNNGGAENFVQGIDYFNNPQTRSFVLTVGLNR